ncbi:MAG TPA: hypothetical protein VHG09_05845 [Longimicrobiales bacterium]|nr:hypothetical protein [Longimicrobiales bacterium]
MIEMMVGLIGLTATAGAAGFGYIRSKTFVARRLRYVDSVQSPVAPFVAGIAATALATPIVWALPFVGAGTAIIFGVATGAGTRAGVRQIRRLISPGF